MKRLTVNQAAKRLSLDPSRVRALLAAKRIKAKKVMRDWLIDENDLNRFAALDRKPGRPRKEQTK